MPKKEIFYSSPVTPEQDYWAERFFEIHGTREELYFTRHIAEEKGLEKRQRDIDRTEAGIGSFSKSYYEYEYTELSKIMKERM
jgi:hypothetical protein